MNNKDVKRLEEIEIRVREIAEENGLITTDILFELVSPSRMIEAMAYNFPTNFSHWSHGRDYDRQRTIYDHTGAGIPYEVVWNFDNPRAFLVDTHPFALNVTTMCHVYGHVDFFLGNSLLKHGLSFSDIASEARSSAIRFEKYKAKYGEEKVEKIIDSGMSIQWLQNPDPYFEEVPEEEIRRRLIELERGKLRDDKSVKSEFSKRLTSEEITKIETHLKNLKYKTPPIPEYDVLKYIIEHSPKPLRDWEKDVLNVIRNQARYLAPQIRTKLLNEGWATYWHTRIMRQLFKEGFLTDKEHGIYDEFHSKLLTKNKKALNWYSVGLALYEYVEDRWNKGQFGIEYEDNKDIRKRLTWDTGAMAGRDKLFEIRTSFTDRMGIEEFFTDEFIHQEELYIWEEVANPLDGIIYYIVSEKKPEVIREILKRRHTLYNMPLINVFDGNYKKANELYLLHEFTGFELNPRFENGALENIYRIWGRPVHLETFEIIMDEFILDDTEDYFASPIIHSYDGAEHSFL